MINSTMLLPATRARAERYVEIAGTIQITTHLAAPRPNLEETFSVVCVVGLGRWQIQEDYCHDAVISFTYDGTNVYQSTRLLKPADSTETASVIQQTIGTKFQMLPFEAAKATTTIGIADTAGGHPIGDQGGTLPWLAFCSGPFLKRQGRVIPLPIAVLRHAPDAFAYSDETTTFPDELGLPRVVNLYTSKTLFRESVTNSLFEGNHRAEVWQAATARIQDGLLKFRYAVTESTNLDGWDLPLAFEFVQNRSNREGNWGVEFSGYGKTTSIRNVSTPADLPFQTGSHQTIIDYRFRDAAKAVHSLIYPYTNGIPPTTNDPSLQKKFREFLRRVPPDPSVIRRRARLLLITLVLVLAVFPVSVMIRKSRNVDKP